MRRPADDDVRHRLEPWLAVLVNVLAHLRAGGRRAWRRGRAFDAVAWRWARPGLVRLGAGVLVGVGAAVDQLANFLAAFGSLALRSVTAVEARLATALSAAARHVARGVAVLAAFASRAVPRRTTPAARRDAALPSAAAGVREALPHAASRAVRALGRASRRAAPPSDAVATPGEEHRDEGHQPLVARLRRAPVRAAVGLAALVVLGWLAVGPVLRLAALPVQAGLPDGGLPPLDERSTVVANDGSVLAVLHDEIDRRVVALDQVPAHVQQAVLAAEDRRFREHDGYDLEAMLRALAANLRAGEVTQGGSTITQQVAKQNLVGDERTVTRKLREVVHAVALEQRLSKDELLERYLNEVYFGSGAYGVAAAAEEFFAVPVESLTVPQAALLAGLIRSPGSLDPRSEEARAVTRRNQVLAVMAAQGWLDPGEGDGMSRAPAGLAHEAAREPLEPHVVAAVKAEFLVNPRFGATREERAALLLNGGLRIEVTVNPGLQAVAREVVQRHLEPGSGPTAALAAIEPSTGRILALHGGEDFARRQFNLATQGRRQPGSAFKPLVAAAALEAGLDPHQGLEGDGPATFDHGGPRPWTVHNYERRDHGRVDLHEALVDSVNTAFAQLGVAVGPGAVADVARRLGIDVEQALGPPERRGPAVALGGLHRGVTAVEMAAAYAALATAGQRPEPFLIARVLDRHGTVLFERQPRLVPALEPAVTGVLVEALHDAVETGTGTAARLDGWTVAGKTGTTQDHADAWFVGAVPVLSTAVWVGHPDEPVPVPGLTGGSIPARIWLGFMQRTLQDLTPVDFPAVPRSVTRPDMWLDLPDPVSGRG